MWCLTINALVACIAWRPVFPACGYIPVSSVSPYSPDGWEWNTSSPWQQIAREVKALREWLKYALEEGLLVTALDGLFWFGSQRIAADVLRLRKAGMPVVTTTVEVHDNLTGTTRKVPAYHLWYNHQGEYCSGSSSTTFFILYPRAWKYVLRKREWQGPIMILLICLWNMNWMSGWQREVMPDWRITGTAWQRWLPGNCRTAFI